MTLTQSRIPDLLCDRPECARLLTGMYDETPDQLRERAASRGWFIFDAKDLCPTCAQRADL